MHNNGCMPRKLFLCYLRCLVKGWGGVLGRKGKEDYKRMEDEESMEKGVMNSRMQRIAMSGMPDAAEVV